MEILEPNNIITKKSKTPKTLLSEFNNRIDMTEEVGDFKLVQ